MKNYTAQDYLNPAKQATLGFGTMRFPKDKAETARMIDTYLDHGYNYIDTAYIYTNSEETLKETLVKRHPRDKYFMANKLPPWMLRKCPEDCVKLFEEQLRRTGLEYFDYYLVHSLSDDGEQKVEDWDLFGWCLEQKKKGLIKHLGFSFHGGTAYLERLLKRHPESEFVQLQQNYLDNLRGPAHEWHDLAVKYNKPIIVMEPVKGGALAKLPPAAEKLLKEYTPNRSIASWAIQYTALLQNVTCVLSGMSNMEQMNDNLKTFEDMKPLTAQERELLDQVLNELAKFTGIPCTACKYCHGDCPLNIDIAASFALYNDAKRDQAGNSWNTAMVYRSIPESNRAEACIKCGACVSNCPQHIDIPKEMDKVVKQFA